MDLAKPAGAAPIHWAISPGQTSYLDALDVMQARAKAIRDHGASELVWLLEHPPLYTAGTGAKTSELLDAGRLPVFQTGRGGGYTYHGPGQRVVYVMLDLRRWNNDVRALVASLETWIVATLHTFNVKGETRAGRVGVWVSRPGQDGPREDKIAAMGLRVSRSVTTHGISLNVEPDLAQYRGIIPCGLAGYGVTSLTDLGLPLTMRDVDVALRVNFERLFGPVIRTTGPLLAA